MKAAKQGEKDAKAADKANRTAAKKQAQNIVAPMNTTY